MKLIKLTNDHYIIVDDSEIKEGDYYLFTWGGEQDIQRFFKEQYADRENHKHLYTNACKKITHSTRPLEKEKITNPTTQIVRDAMKIVSKDVIAPKVVRDGLVKPIVELLSLQEVKELIGEVDVEKKYTEEDLRYMFECGRNYQNNAEITFKVSMEYLQPKTEWELEFIDGKLKLK